VKTFPPLVLNSGEFTPVRAGCPGAAGERIMALYEDRSIRADDCSIRSSWRLFGVGRIPTRYTASELAGVAGFEPAASSSGSQIAVRAVSAAAYLTCERPSAGVRWCLPLSVAIVTHLVTRLPRLRLDHLGASTPRLSGIVAHLGLCLACIRWDRHLSGPVVVRLGGQSLPHVGPMSI
jgi:hypothetical protein